MSAVVVREEGDTLWKSKKEQNLVELCDYVESVHKRTMDIVIYIKGDKCELLHGHDIEEDWIQIFDCLETLTNKKLLICHEYSSLAHAEEITEKIVQSLRRNRNLCHLSLLSSSVKTMMKILHGTLVNPRITSFSIKSDHESDKIPSQLIPLLKLYPKVRLSRFVLRLNENMEHVYREFCSYCDKLSVKCIFPSELFSLPRLDVVYELKAYNIDGLEEILYMMPALRSLKINLSDEDDVTGLVSAIRDHPCLDKITLTSWRGPIEEIIRSRPFSTIKLKVCNIETIRAICVNRKLRKLSIKKELELDDVIELLNSLSSSPLRSLTVYTEKLDNNCWEALSVLDRQGLESLDLGYSEAPGIAKFLSSLRHLRTLSVIHIQEKDTLEVLRRNTTLRALVSLDVKEFFISLLKDNTVLCSIEPVYHSKVESLLKRNITGWNPRNHHSFPERIRQQIRSLLESGFFQESRLPAEILFQIFRYLL